MRIGVDATCWWNRRGFGRFTRELLTAMFAIKGDHRFCLFIDQPPDDQMTHDHVNIRQIGVARTVTEAAVAEDSRNLGDLWAMRRAILSEPMDVMFFPAVYSWVPVPKRLKTIVTLHDAIAEDFPELVFPDRRGRFLWGMKMKMACRQARRILTVSQASKGSIVRHMKVNPDRIDYVYEAADARFQAMDDPAVLAQARTRSKLPAEGRIITFVGGIAPHKNLLRLLSGFAQAIAKGGMDDVHLVFVGDPEGDGFHSNFHDLLAQIEADPKLTGRVHFTGFVSDEDLVALYTASLATAMPSLFEGFGLPAIEAMACGTPILASTTGAVPEVVGDGGLYFEPTDVNQIADAIHKIATSPELAKDLATIARKRAATFTWARAAEETLAILKTAGNKP